MVRKARRRALSLTPLIDVIFLLLLFFMLSSSFSKFGEVELQVAGSGASNVQRTDLVFLRLSEDSLSVNGTKVLIENLALTIGSAEQTLAVSVRPNVTAQRMTDLLVAMQGLPDATVIFLGGG